MKRKTLCCFSDSVGGGTFSLKFIYLLALRNSVRNASFIKHQRVKKCTPTGDREQKKETKERRIHHDYQSFFSIFLPKIGQGILRLLLSHELEKGILPDLAIFPTERKNSPVAKLKSLLNLFRSNMSDKMTLGRKG